MENNTNGSTEGKGKRNHFNASTRRSMAVPKLKTSAVT